MAVGTHADAQLSCEGGVAWCKLIRTHPPPTTAKEAVAVLLTPPATTAPKKAAPLLPKPPDTTLGRKVKLLQNKTHKKAEVTDEPQQASGRAGHRKGRKSPERQSELINQRGDREPEVTKGDVGFSTTNHARGSSGCVFFPSTDAGPLSARYEVSLIQLRDKT